MLVLFTLFGVLILLPGVDEGREPVGSFQRLTGSAAEIGFIALMAPVLLLSKWVPNPWNNAIEWSILGLNSLLYGSMAAWLWFKVARRQKHRAAACEQPGGGHVVIEP